MKLHFFEIKADEEIFLKEALKDHDVIFTTDALTPENVDQFLDSEIISTRAGSIINNEVINKLTNLKLIALRITGFDNIDLKTAAEKNIPVSNVPTYGEHTVAEYAVALLLSLSRKIITAVNQTKATSKFNTQNLEGFDLKDKTIGVIGTGHIGVHVIQIAKGFEMKVIAFDAFPNNDLAGKFGFEYQPLDQVLNSSDILSIHVPYLPSTHHLINMQNISQIKKGAVLINTARGAIIETESLVKALEDGILSAVGLDVLEEENYFKEGENSQETTEEIKKIISLNEKLLKMGNVIITPHNAFNSKEANQRILDTTVENIKSFENGQPTNLVKPKP